VLGEMHRRRTRRYARYSDQRVTHGSAPHRRFVTNRGRVATTQRTGKTTDRITRGCGDGGFTATTSTTKLRSFQSNNFGRIGVAELSQSVFDMSVTMLHSRLGGEGRAREAGNFAPARPLASIMQGGSAIGRCRGRLRHFHALPT
jgi:hypothetical protein